MRSIVHAICAGAIVASLTAGQPEPLIDLPSGVDLPRLIDLLSAETGIPIDYDPALIRGTVTVRADAGVERQAMKPLVLELLAARGFAVVAGESGHLRVVKAAEAKQHAAILEAPSGEYCAILVRAMQLDARALADSIKPLLSNAGDATVLGTSGLIRLSDHGPRLISVLDLLPSIDVRGPLEVVEIPVNASTADTVVSAVGLIVAKESAITGTELPGEIVAAPGDHAVLVIAPPSATREWTDLVRRVDKPRTRDRRWYTVDGHDLNAVATLITETVGADAADPTFVEVVVDELTQSLSIVATPEDHARVDSLVTRLGEAAEASPRVVRAFSLKNRGVDDLLQVLEELISAGALGDVAAKVAIDPTTATSSNSAGTADQYILGLTADESTNSLIAVGPSRLLAQLGDLITQLDTRQPQVMVEALLVSLSDGESLDFGVELERLEVSGGTFFKLSSLFGLSSGAGGGITDVGRSVEDGTGFTGLVLDPGEFSVVVRALQTISDGKGVRRPKLLVNNNESASFDSINEQPFTSVNASQTVTTTSFGGFEPAGTQITVTPQIANGDHLVLEYTLSLSTFVGESATEGIPPARQQNNLQSVATIPDGFTIILGGFEETTEGEAVSQIPLVGSIPIIGELFKNRSSSESRSRFYAFVTARVLRNEGFESLKYTSDLDLEDAGVDDDWPEVRPSIIR